jgi:hypothetical protein
MVNGVHILQAFQLSTDFNSSIVTYLGWSMRILA